MNLIFIVYFHMNSIFLTMNRSLYRQVTGSTAGWLGIGFSEGATVSMTGGTGGGCDAFICSDGEVKRYWNLEDF